MPTYVGTKVVEAWPEDRTIHDTGEAQAGYAVKYDDGYKSWSPDTVFNKHYTPLTNMTFGHALEMMKRGEKVSRKGWERFGEKSFWLDGEDFKAQYSKLIVTENVLSSFDIVATDWYVVE